MRLTEDERQRLTDWCRVAGYYTLASTLGMAVGTLYQVRRGAALSESRRNQIVAAIAHQPPPRRCPCGVTLAPSRHAVTIFCDACAEERARAPRATKQAPRRRGRPVAKRTCPACGGPEVKDGRLVVCVARCCPPRFA